MTIAYSREIFNWIVWQDSILQINHVGQSITVSRSLPTAYVVRGKVMFWHVSVHPSIHPSFCLSTGGGGVPEPGPASGGTPARSSQGGTPTGGGGYPTLGTTHQTWPGGYPTLGVTGVSEPGPASRGVPEPGPAGGYLCWGVPHLGYPLSDPSRGYPCWGYPTLGPPPLSDLAGGYPTLGNRWSTWYVVVGMPLAFMQEDFLVGNINSIDWNHVFVSTFQITLITVLSVYWVSNLVINVFINLGVSV